MLQDIRRQKLGKSGSKFPHGGDGYQKWPKKFRRLLWMTPNQQLSSGTVTRIYRNTKYAPLAAIGSSIRDIDIFFFAANPNFLVIPKSLAQDSPPTTAASNLCQLQLEQLEFTSTQQKGFYTQLFVLRHIIRHFCNVLHQNNGNLKQNIGHVLGRKNQIQNWPLCSFFFLCSILSLGNLK